MRLYLESRRDPGDLPTVEAPVAITMLPADLYPTPREWVERQWPLARWTELPRGGHFAEWEVPELIAADVRAFFAALRQAESRSAVAAPIGRAQQVPDERRRSGDSEDGGRAR